MCGEALADLETDVEHRIERGHRFLKNHANALSANVLKLRLGICGKVISLEDDTASTALQCRWQQAHDG